MIRHGQSNITAIDPGEALKAAKARLDGAMAHPNLFLLPRDDARSEVLADLLRERLQGAFRLQVCEVSPASPNAGSAEHLCIAIDSSRPEAVRDAIKEQLWAGREETRAIATLADILQGRCEKTSREFRLDEYGIFIPCRTRKFAEVRIHSFPHSPAYYRYRLALARTDRLPAPMAEFLHALFADCPNHLFDGTACRASRVCRSGLDIEIPLTPAKQHDIIRLAQDSHSHTSVSSRHENLQKHFLDHDPCTVACEVPVWIESWEFQDYPGLLRTRDPLTGHIDVLRHEPDGRLGVWDYKPRAAAERTAHVQVFLYALMLALRTGLPLSRFLCGYFDETDAYTFDPAQVTVANSSE